ncbi:SGNH/GDSL hydrolase family protein [Anaerobacillus sp. MEB173]|uniref:SGNH/GDSL hydrolase family protein n=1 Tax=Anaerobacillus sp. MEB173 TaxID=3383345 RepID=UPI003F92D301
MKKTFKLVILLLIFSLLFSGGAFAQNDNAKKSLVALGDSIPYGLNLGVTNSTSSKLAFPSIIGEDANLRVRNLAVSGWKTEDMLNALKNDQKYRQAVGHADYITLNIGSNDLLEILQNAGAECGNAPVFEQCLMVRITEGLTNSDLLDNLNEILAEIRSISEAPVVVYNIYNPFREGDKTWGHLNQLGHNILPGVNGLIFLSAMNNNASIADAYTAFETGLDNNVLENDIHPSVEGHVKLAEIGLAGFGLE